MDGHPRRWAVFGVLCLAVFVVSVDLTMLNIALPKLSVSLHAGSSQLQWIVDAYSLALAGALLTSGSLSDRFGRRKFLIIGLVIFAAGSAVGAVADTSWQIIAARAVMGIGASCFMPGTLSVLVQVFPEDKRATAIGAWGAVTSLGVIIGPLLGGTLLAHFWWGSIFVANVIVSLVATIGVVAIVPESKDPAARRIDIPGAVLSTLAFVALTYAIIETAGYGWGSHRVLGGFAVGVVALILFAIRQATAKSPMLSLRQLTDRRFAGGGLTAAAMMFAVTGTLFVLTQQFQLILHYGTLRAGVAFLPVAGAVAVGSILGPMLSNGVQSRILVGLGLLLIAVGLVVLAKFAPGSGYPPIVTSLVVIGLGMGLATPLANDVLMSSGPLERSGLISAMNDTVQELGAALGVAVIGSVMAARYTHTFSLAGAGAAKQSLPQAIVAAGSAPAAGAAILTAAHHAFGEALRTSALVCAVIVAVAAVLVALLMPNRSTAQEKAPENSTEKTNLAPTS